MILFSKPYRYIFFHLTAGIAFLLFSSCGTRYGKEIATLDSLQKQLSKADSIISITDTVTIVKTVYVMTARLNDIEQNCKDTLSLNVARMLDKYNSSRESLKRSVDKILLIKNDMLRQKERIESLRYDLDKNLHKPDAVIQYVNAENENVKSVFVSVELLKSVISDELKTADSLHLKVEELVQKNDIK